jgi:hypothetical protein
MKKKFMALTDQKYDPPEWVLFRSAAVNTSADLVLRGCVRLDRRAVRLLRFDVFLQVFGFAFHLFSLGQKANGGGEEQRENNSSFHG